MALDSRASPTGVFREWEFHMSSKGTIKRIVSDKGFGFVADESGQEYFFHQSACQSFDSLREGQAVTFQTGQGPKVRGPRTSRSLGALHHFVGGRHGVLSRIPGLSTCRRPLCRRC